MAKDAVVLDFTNVKDSAKFTKKHLEPGDYKARVTGYEVTKPKDKSDKTPMWLFTITLEGRRNASYPYYCKLQENQLWKIRNLFAAAGITIPKKRASVDPNRIVGKLIGITLEDEEYEGKMQSVVDAVIPVSEVGGVVAAEDDEDEDTEDEEEEATEADDEEDDDDEDQDAYDVMDRDELKGYIKGSELDIKVKKTMSDDDIRAAIRAAEASSDDEEEDEEDDEEPEEAPKAVKKKGKKRAAVTDDELEELGIEDL